MSEDKIYQNKKEIHRNRKENQYDWMFQYFGDYDEELNFWNIVNVDFKGDKQAMREAFMIGVL